MVVPLTGHVDRNPFLPHAPDRGVQSCPSRGTWIEMYLENSTAPRSKVVPLTGHVDRNKRFGTGRA